MGNINIFQKFLNTICDKFRADTAKMLIWTSLAGYALSSLAQITAIGCSSKFSNEQKSYLLPQECGDALANILTFLVITMATKKTVAKMFETGKWGTKSVKTFLKSKPELAKQIGKLDFNIVDHIKDAAILQDYNSSKALGTTVATIGAGIVSSSIVTPLLRNNMATKGQRNYKQTVKELQKQEVKSANQQNIYKNHLQAYNYKSDMKI